MAQDTHEHILTDALYAFFLSQKMVLGITNLSILDRSVAEYNFQDAKDNLSRLSGRVITADLAQKWIERLDEIIRLIYSDERRALYMARGLLLEMEIKFKQMLRQRI